MPVVFRDGSLVFFFYSNEGLEPVHIHVRRGSPRGSGAHGKWWLDPLSEAYSEGFTAAELRRIKASIVGHESEIREAWRRHFGRG